MDLQFYLSFIKLKQVFLKYIINFVTNKTFPNEYIKIGTKLKYILKRHKKRKTMPNPIFLTSSFTSEQVELIRRQSSQIEFPKLHVGC